MFYTMNKETEIYITNRIKELVIEHIWEDFSEVSFLTSFIQVYIEPAKNSGTPLIKVRVQDDIIVAYALSGTDENDWPRVARILYNALKHKILSNGMGDLKNPLTTRQEQELKSDEYFDNII